MSRAIAIWSATYGITEEEIPTPMPASDRDRVPEGGHRRPTGHRRDAHERDEHRRRQPVDARDRGRSDAVREHDVGREQAGVRQRERHAERLDLELHAGEQVHARHGQRERRALRLERAPSAASAITGRNSIAATVASGSRSIAR